MPTVLPRRQTTSQLRPVLLSRENASRNLAGSVLGSFDGQLRARRGQILHHAWTRSKAAFERDPAWLIH
jgi:hypothetical protein